MEKILVGFVSGFIIGGCFMLVVVAFFMGARPDTPQKRMEDAEGLSEYMASRPLRAGKYRANTHKPPVKDRPKEPPKGWCTFDE